MISDWHCGFCYSHYNALHVFPINGAIIVIYDVLRMDLPQRIRICPPITYQYSTA